MILKEVYYTHQGYIYSVKKYTKIVILLQLKMTVFYLNIFKMVFIPVMAKQNISIITLVFNVT